MSTMPLLTLTYWLCFCFAACSGDAVSTDSALDIITTTPDPCMDHDCDNGGTCQLSGSQVSCVCAPQWTGDDCGQVVTACSEGACDHGYCVAGDDTTSYQCTCFQGWTGPICSQDVNECDSPRCDATEDCLNNNGSYTCQCKSGNILMGEHCKENIFYATPLSSSAEPEPLRFDFPYNGQMTSSVLLTKDGRVIFNSKSTLPALVHPTMVLYVYWEEGNFPPTCDTCLTWQHIPMVGMDKEANLELKQQIQNDILKYGNVEDFEPTNILVATWRDVPPYPAEIYSGHQNATYQLVLVTDGEQSFALYHYDGWKMSWDPESENRTIVLGRSLANGSVSHIPVRDVYRPDLDSNVDVPGRFFYPLSVKVENKHPACLKWYYSQSVVTSGFPCPCTKQQAYLDTRFVPSASDQDPVCLTSRFAIDGVLQHCCYDSERGFLLNSRGSGSYSELVNSQDMEGSTKCCEDTDLCHLFYEVRPVDNCSFYVYPAWALGWGNLHFRTVDGVEYTFSGLGDYVLLQGLDQFELQGRTGLLAKNSEGELTNATALTALALKSGDSVVVEWILAEGSVQLNINNTPTTLPGSEGLTTPEYEVTQLPNGHYLTQFQSGMGIQVSVSGGSLAFTLTIQDDVPYTASTVGLLGTLDGDPDNDFKDSDGVVHKSTPDDPLSEEQLYDILSSWAVTGDNSLFTQPGTASDNFRPPFYADKIDKNNGIIPGVDNDTIAFCEDNLACLVDYYATESEDIATATKMYQETQIATLSMLGIFPPDFSSVLPSYLSVYVGVTASLMVTARLNDDDQPAIIREMTNIIESEYTFIDGQFSWTPSDIYKNKDHEVFIGFLATDPYTNATVMYQPKVRMCACAKTGTCRFPELDFSEQKNANYQSGECDCDTGYHGDLCDQELDLCVPSPCHHGVNCSMEEQDFTCDACPSGMKGDGRGCYGDNECISGVANCEQGCHNQADGYTCLCHQGYTVQTDGQCEEVDECVSEHPPCSLEGQYCWNTPGSYTCTCKAVYAPINSTCIKAGKKFKGTLKFDVLLSDGVALQWSSNMKDPSSESYKKVASRVEQQVTEIYENLVDADQVWTVVTALDSGSIVTSYDLYFHDQTDVNASTVAKTMSSALEQCGAGGACAMGDIMGINVSASTVTAGDLCASTLDNDCDVSSTDCDSFQDGTFKCTCKSGFTTFLDLHNICQDVNECEEDADLCEAESTVCLNLPGGYRCDCAIGYRMKNHSCIEVCEPNPCENDGVCVAEDHGFTCKCDGYWTGPTCGSEHDEAVRLKKIAIIVGAVVGAICVVLLVLLIIACCRMRGEEVGRDAWEPNSRQHLRGNEKYEMTENGSNENLVDSDARNVAPSRTGPRTEGMNNPAFTDTPGGKDGMKTQRSTVSGEYF